MVLVQDENVPSHEWPFARVVRVYPGKDGIIRSAQVQTERGRYDRPVVKLRRLPIQLDPECPHPDAPRPPKTDKTKKDEEPANPAQLDTAAGAEQ